MSKNQNQYQRDVNNVSYMYTLPPQERIRTTFYKPPPVIGYWVFPGSTAEAPTKFAMSGKPNKFHRMMMKWMLGWVWEDEK